MKNKVVFFLALILALSFALCACAAEEPIPTKTEATAPESTVEPSSEPATVPVTEPETTPEETAGESISTAYIPGAVNLPVPEQIGSAVFSEVGYLESGEFVIIYSDADEEALELYLRLCGYCGLYAWKVENTAEQWLYLLIQPSLNYFGILYYLPESGDLQIVTDSNVNLLLPDGIEGVTAYYLQEFSVPGATTPNILPQFYASVGSLPVFQKQMGGSVYSYAFDGELCWTEMYENIDYSSMETYLRDAQFCGFDVVIDASDVEDNKIQILVFRITNGDLEVVVYYHAVDQTASVHYKPGVSLYLLSGDEYAMCIP